MAPKSRLDVEELPSVNASVSHSTLTSNVPSVTGGTRCPLREGPLTLDALLADLGRDRDEAEALDLALDLRYAYLVTRDAAACAEFALKLGRALGERHYLAHFRVRLWLTRALALEIRGHRGETWNRYALPLIPAPGQSTEEVCLKRWTQEHSGRSTALAQVRYVFAA